MTPSEPQQPEPEVPRAPRKPPRAAAAPLTMSATVLALRDELRSCDTHAAREFAIEHFWAKQERTPLLEANNPGRAFAEGHYTVTFLWQDAKAEEVLLHVTGLTDERDLAASLMKRVPGTDVWHLSYRMQGDWRASYAFHPRLAGERWPWEAQANRDTNADAAEPHTALESPRHFEAGQIDPRNMRLAHNHSGAAMSVVALPDAPAQLWSERRPMLTTDQRGDLSEQIGPDGHRVWIYLPPGYAQAAPSTVPVAVLLDGEIWAQTQAIADTADNMLVDRAMRPCVLVMVEHAHVAAGQQEPSQAGAAPFAEADSATEYGETAWFADRLLPWLRERYDVSERPSDTVIVGQRLGAYVALRAAIERPDAFGAVLSQSAALRQRRLPAPDLSLIRDVHVYIEVGTQERSLREPNERLASEFTRFGCDTHFTLFNGGADYACWRGGMAEGLRTLIGPA